eukprot:4904612-Pleurochrysis_carterae.AAC.1
MREREAETPRLPLASRHCTSSVSPADGSRIAEPPARNPPPVKMCTTQPCPEEEVGDFLWHRRAWVQAALAIARDALAAISLAVALPPASVMAIALLMMMLVTLERMVTM